MAGLPLSTRRRRVRKSGLNNGKLDTPVQPRQPPVCPECSSSRIWKDGLRKTRKGVIQRYLCRSCGSRFSESTTDLQVKVDVARKISEVPNPRDDDVDFLIPDTDPPIKEGFDKGSLLGCEYVGPHGSSSERSIPELLNTLRFDTGGRRVRAKEAEAKNLAKVEPQQKRASAGATETDTKSLTFQFAWWLKKNGYREATIKSYTSKIKSLVNHGADLLDPESVKEVLARTDQWCESSKCVVTNVYTTFLEMHGLTWNPPRYRLRKTLPFIPTEGEINDLVANCGPKTSTALRAAKETGARVGEIAKLKWIDLDREKKLLRINEPEKGSDPRILSISNSLINMVERMPKNDEYIFATRNGIVSPDHLCKLLYRGRKTAARKLGNPRLDNITFHTIRHWKGTIEYHKTKDIIHVKQLPGHKNIQNTMIYINLEQAIFKETDDEFTVRVADSLDEARKLLEVGFGYVCEMDGKKLFRKRK